MLGSVTLVTTVEDVIANISTYHSVLPSDTFLQSRVARTAWWYAFEKNGDWLFAPSKFVGYKNMSATKYRRNFETKLDGRDTETVLKALFQNVDSAAPLFQELKAALKRHLESFGAEIGGRFKGFRIAPVAYEAVEPERRENLRALAAMRIVSDRDICGGRPRIKGTRIRIVDIVEAIAAGVSREEILADFPDLTSEDIVAALLYSARAVDHAVFRAA